jgi:hypothetical protein
MASDRVVGHDEVGGSGLRGRTVGRADSDAVRVLMPFEEVAP